MRCVNPLGMKHTYPYGYIITDYKPVIYTNMIKLLSASAMAVVLLAACQGNAQQNTEEVIYQENNITVKESSPILTKLKYETIALQPFSNEFRTVGTVQAETGHFAEVNVPFD